MGATDIIDYGHDHVATDIDDRGMHIFDPDAVEWEAPAPATSLRPSTGSASGTDAVARRSYRRNG